MVRKTRSDTNVNIKCCSRFVSCCITDQQDFHAILQLQATIQSGIFWWLDYVIQYFINIWTNCQWRHYCGSVCAKTQNMTSQLLLIFTIYFATKLCTKWKTYKVQSTQWAQTDKNVTNKSMNQIIDCVKHPCSSLGCPWCSNFVTLHYLTLVARGTKGPRNETPR